MGKACRRHQARGWTGEGRATSRRVQNVDPRRQTAARNATNHHPPPGRSPSRVVGVVGGGRACVSEIAAQWRSPVFFLFHRMLQVIAPSLYRSAQGGGSGWLVAYGLTCMVRHRSGTLRPMLQTHGRLAPLFQSKLVRFSALSSRVASMLRWRFSPTSEEPVSPVATIPVQPGGHRVRYGGHAGNGVPQRLPIWKVADRGRKPPRRDH
ncbi:hypothetical protein ANO11243_024630 [Dothideomycetidae sp. 11243]|nr:hypothetical protein ANO11243_024630 [fungal sp. No.11243]